MGFYWQNNHWNGLLVTGLFLTVITVGFMKIES